MARKAEKEKELEGFPKDVLEYLNLQRDTGIKEKIYTNLINQAVMKIRTSVRPMRNVFDVEQSADTWAAVDMPKNCRRIISGSIREVTDTGPCHTNNYKLVGNREIWLPPGKYLVEYEAFPGQLPANPVDSYYLPEEPDVVIPVQEEPIEPVPEAFNIAPGPAFPIT